MTNPKLALIPSAYKAGKLYSPLPTSGDGDFTFERNSTATRVNKDGLIEEVAIDTPRLDYSGGGCPSLLLEPSRTNLITYSSEVNEANTSDFVTGTGITPTVLSDDELAPDGSLTAREWNFNVGSGTSSSDIAIINTSYASTIGLDYTMSVYLYSSIDNVQIYVRAAGSIYTLRTLSLGWNRVEVTDEAVSTSSSWLIGLRQGLSSGTINSNVTVKVWGLQVEQGSNATSYIPTNGSIATRVADLCVDSGNTDVFNDSEGVLFVDVTPKTPSGASADISLNNANFNNRVVMLFYPTNQMRAYSNSNGVDQFSSDQSITLGERIKVAIAYKQDYFRLYLNGVLVDSSTSGDTPIGLSGLDLSQFNNTLGFEGTVHDVRYYDTVLTDAELTELTTL